MANWAWLKGCGSIDAARTFVEMRDRPWEETTSERDGPVMGGKNVLPLFWLAAFSAGDAFTAKAWFEDWETDQPLQEQVVALCAPAERVLATLRRRRAAVIAAVRPEFTDAYDAWTAFVGRQYDQWILVDASELHSQSGFDEVRSAIRSCLLDLEKAEQGTPLMLGDSFESLGSTDPTHSTLIKSPYSNDTPGSVVFEWVTDLVGGTGDMSWLPEPPASLFSLAEEKIRTAEPIQTAPSSTVPKRNWWNFW